MTVNDRVGVSPDAVGWVSTRFCSYPQEIGLYLVSDATTTVLLRRLELTVSESFVPTKIVVAVANPASSSASYKSPLSDRYKMAHFKRVAELRFQDSGDRDFAVREMKQVKCSEPVTFVKLLIYGNYPQHDNVYSQVGVAFVKAVGDWLPVSGNTVMDNTGGHAGDIIPGHIAQGPSGGGVGGGLGRGGFGREAVFNPNALHDEATNIELDQILKQHGVVLHGAPDVPGGAGKTQGRAGNGKKGRRGQKVEPDAVLAGGGGPDWLNDNPGSSPASPGGGSPVRVVTSATPSEAQLALQAEVLAQHGPTEEQKAISRELVLLTDAKEHAVEVEPSFSLSLSLFACLN
jgi:hypothetical protein